MVKQNENIGMLDLMVGPCFCVKDHKIFKVNTDAAKLFLEEGASITQFLHIGEEEYAQFRSGCLYLELNIGGQLIGASVTRVDDYDVFVLEPQSDLAELRALSLAAQELRAPLERMMVSADRLMSTPAAKADVEAQNYSARLNRGLSQLLRLVGNMSDAANYHSRQEIQDMPALFREIFEKAQNLTAATGVAFSWSCPEESVYSVADCQELERCVFNLLSNSLKYTPPGGIIHASLTIRGRKLYLQLTDNGEGIPDEIRSNVFRRYLRSPGIEDSRHGIGLGMVMVRSAAFHHEGTVLIDQPEGLGTRVTLTLPIRQKQRADLRSPVMRMDYAGGMDHALIELSECLPSELFI